MEIETNQHHRCAVDGDQGDNDQVAFRDDGTGAMMEDPKGGPLPRNHASPVPVRAVAVRSGQGMN